ncbi:MAG TPA: cation:proton antiporter [Vicinamibacterales bacterium]|nr:cation:proton antiporter [Vicinamibacterales bacterium]
MSLIIAILLLLVVSRVAAELAERAGQPAMIGEIAAGLLLGPSVLNLVHGSPELTAIADLGLLLLMLLAGMEISLDQLFDAFRGRKIWISLLGFLLPLALGIGAGVALGLDGNRTLFIGLCIAITALPVSIRILMDLGRLQTTVGGHIVGAAIANDVLALLMLGVIVNTHAGQSSWGDVMSLGGVSVLKVLIFMAAVLAAARLINRAAGKTPAFHRLTGRLRVKEPLFAVTLTFVVIFAALADALGLHLVVGAFFGALLLSHELLGRENFEHVRKTASAVTMGFLAPLFFATIGLEFDAASLSGVWLPAVILTVAFVGKIAAGRLGGWLAGLGPAESWALGIGLNGRGIMELVVARIGLTSGLVGPDIFSVLVLMGVTTTVITPVLLKRAFEAVDRDRTSERRPEARRS